MYILYTLISSHISRCKKKKVCCCQIFRKLLFSHSFVHDVSSAIHRLDSFLFGEAKKESSEKIK